MFVCEVNRTITIFNKILKSYAKIKKKALNFMFT